MQFFDYCICSSLLFKLQNVCGPNDLPPYIFVWSFSFVCALSLYITFRKILDVGENHAIWKFASLLPSLRKDLNLMFPTKSHPCHCSSILEEIIFNKVINLATKKRATSCKQHAYMLRRSSVAQMLFYVSEWIKSVDKNEVVCIIYLNTAETSESISHKNWFSFLSVYALRTSLVRWLTSSSHSSC